MRRREFISLLGGAATLPLAAHAQQPAMPVIGFLSTLSPSNMAANVMNEFRQGLKEAGFVEGQNVKIEYRWAEGHYDRLPALAADLVHRQVAVIAATGGEPSPQVVKAATQTIPIVFMANGDPVAAGLVASLNRPGGNLTGVTIFGMMAAGKRLELLRQLMPKAGMIAYLMNPNNPNWELDNVQAAARSLGQQILVLNADSDREIDTAFATVAQQRVAALLVASDPLFFDRRDQLIALAARQAVPAIYYLRAFSQAGGLLSYGNNLADMYRQVGTYTGRVLNGERPADLPVMHSGAHYRHVWEGDYMQVFEGAYFADSLAMADKDGRIGEVRADPNLSLRAFWDIGGAGARADATAIWVVQFVTSEIRVLDYIELRGQKVGDVLAELRHRGWEKAICHLPHDGSNANNVTGKTYEDHIREAGFSTTVTRNAGAGAARRRIEAVRRLFPKMWFNLTPTEKR